MRLNTAERKSFRQPRKNEPPRQIRIAPKKPTVDTSVRKSQRTEAATVPAKILVARLGRDCLFQEAVMCLWSMPASGLYSVVFPAFFAAARAVALFRRSSD